MSGALSWLKRAAFVFAALAVAAAAEPAAAWSDLGHRVVGDLAYVRLTPAARSQVDALLREAPLSGEPSCPVASLADAAVFPSCVDGIRRYNDMRRLHSEAIPLCAAEARGDPCKDGQCVREAVKRARAVLADQAATPAARLLALEQLTHFMADLHQPMDMIDNRDDNGRDIRITLPGSSDRRLNLHQFWDETMLSVALGDEAIGARYVEPVARAGRGWEAGDVDAWAAETHERARQIYLRLPEPPMCGRRPRDPEMLDRGYVLGAVPAVREQLAKAAVRLASVLNATLR